MSYNKFENLLRWTSHKLRIQDIMNTNKISFILPIICLNGCTIGNQLYDYTL